MNELIKVTQNESGEQLVSARELHEFLEVKKDFSDWIKTYIKNDFYGFEDGIDYTTFKGNSTKSVPRPRIEYILKLDMAKELCMLSKVAKGKETRRYFIEIEKAWNSPEKVMARALQIANKQIETYKDEIKLMQPKVEAYNTLLTADNSQDVGEVAKSFGIGRNKMFKFLREEKFLMSNNTPYQKHLDSLLFEVIEVNKTHGEWSQNFTKTMITPKGIDKIRKLLQDKELI